MTAEGRRRIAVAAFGRARRLNRGKDQPRHTQVGGSAMPVQSRTILLPDCKRPQVGPGSIVAAEFAPGTASRGGWMFDDECVSDSANNSNDRLVSKLPASPLLMRVYSVFGPGGRWLQR